MCVMWMMFIWDFKIFMAAKHTFVRPSISRNNTKHTRHTKPGLASACMHRRPRNLLIFHKLSTLLYYACASSHFRVIKCERRLDREGIISNTRIYITAHIYCVPTTCRQINSSI